MKNKSIILLGIKHSGKSTQGELLANHIGCPFIDIDTVITEMTGKTPRELYNENGPAGFMEAEENACIQTAQKYKDSQVVIATGGGICENAPALEKLRQLGEFVL
ncbi:MAG: shikimate kinase [Treponema porcinum]|uniref:shikimate kinase n=1 Tax=Treponema porcinum TaxID=261392 RepID=UPI002A802742|nr:shikimate kinase [Treponema porcinum]MDY5046660.1 shikimate kinase [Treponema porcinum]